MAGIYGGGDVLESRSFAFGEVELTRDSRGLWLFRVKVAKGGVPHWRFPEFGAIGYRTTKQDYEGDERAMDGEG